MAPSAALSILASPKKPSISTRKIAILVADGVTVADVMAIGKELQTQGTTVAVLAAKLGHVTGAAGDTLAVDYTLKTMPSVLWDAVLVPGGAASAKTLAASGDALLFVREQYKHAKPVCAADDGLAVLESAGIHSGDPAAAKPLGVIVGGAGSAPASAPAFVAAIAQGASQPDRPGRDPRLSEQ